MFLLYTISFFIAGFIQEVLITTYHRAIATHRAGLATIMTISIAVVSLLVVAEVTKKIFDPSFGYFSYLLVAVFALGKGLGTYISVKVVYDRMLNAKASKD